LMSSFVH